MLVGWLNPPKVEPSDAIDRAIRDPDGPRGDDADRTERRQVNAAHNPHDENPVRKPRPTRPGNLASGPR
jgi:hypothetical protein